MKKYRKALSFLLVIMTLFLSSCGGGGGGGTNDDPPADDDMKLSAFLDKVTEAIGPNDRFEAALRSPGLDSAWVLEISYAILDLNMLVTYGSKTFPADRGGYYDVKGSVITFGYDYVRKENDPNVKEYLAGDRELAAGKADLSNNTLICEIFTQRDGKMIRRCIIECAIFSDGSSVLQVLSIHENTPEEGKALFLKSEAAKFTALRGSFPFDANFKFVPVSSRTSITAEEMAAGCTLKWKITSDLNDASGEKF